MDAQETLSTDATSPSSLSLLGKLWRLREMAGQRTTVGLPDATVQAHAARDARLAEAIDEALARRQALSAADAALVSLEESSAISAAQDGFLNFYPQDAVNPYIPLAGVGPWIVTTHGAVLHDNGGYGMLGFGHAPKDILAAMATPQVMANIMTPSLSHRRFVDALRKELGHTRGSCPFDQFLCLNSGSESVTIASRISDINAWTMVKPGGPKAGQKVAFLALTGAFHGRTDRPAQVSHSTNQKYRTYLASFQHRENLITVPPNDIDALEAAFQKAEAEGVFIESMYIEPVMGEGRPGYATSRAFYDAARRLTLAHGSLLVVDSIQAGLRATGTLSIVDYPGFEDCEAPDMETWSKALNGGQYPLSVLGLTKRAAAIYKRGVYGNTMTGNPRGLDVACAVLARITPALRENIRVRGQEFVAGLEQLRQEFPSVVVSVSGTGLLFCAELTPGVYTVEGFGGVEEKARHRGLGVIHGGKNALRFTPNFDIRAEEVTLVLSLLRQLFTDLASQSAA